MMADPSVYVAEEASSPRSPISTTWHSSDLFHFGYLWPRIKDELKSQAIIDLIIERKREILASKEEMRPLIEIFKQPGSPWYDCWREFHRVWNHGKLIVSTSGSGGAYFLKDENNIPRYVIKALDEDILCLHNRKGKASPFFDSEHQAREAISCYRSVQREMMSSYLSQFLGIADITPWVIIDILQSDSFYDISEIFEGDEKTQLLNKIGSPDKEKVCSIQPFSRETIELTLAIHEWFESGKELAGELLPLDQDSFEKANLLIWLTYDCDGHGSNFLLYLHSLNEKGQCLYGLKKIDGGLTFPNKNESLCNYLAYLPNAKKQLSKFLRKKIEQINPDEIEKNLSLWGLEDAIQSFKIRVRVLKDLAMRPEMTIEEMNFRMELLSLSNGLSLALSMLSKKELEEEMLKPPSHQTE